MSIRSIKNEADYDAALAEIDRLMGAAPGSPASDELKRLVAQVEAYEAEHHPVGAVSIDRLRERIAGRARVDLSISAAEAVRQERDSR